MVVAILLFWTVRGSSAPPVRQAPAKTPAKAATAPKKAPVYKRSTSIRRTYGTATSATKKNSNKRVATKWKAKGPAPRRVFYNPGQQAPTQDRYAEIERALADRGYLQKEPDGKWDQRSADALKKFQGEQNLRADGKLGAMSLIALGLGPKRTAPAAVAPIAPQLQAPKPANLESPK